MSYVPKPGEEPKYHCTKCHEPVYTTNYYDPYGSKMTENSWCFSCVFWSQYAEAPLSNSLVIDGHHYKAKPGIVEIGRFNSIQTRSELGMGGRTFTIRDLSTGETWQTNNLWSQGKISEPWLEHFPNTHEFVTAEKVEVDDLICWISG